LIDIATDDPVRITWSQGESVRLRVPLVRANLGVDIATTTVPRLLAWADGAPETALIDATGSVTDNEAVVDLDPAAANMVAGDYLVNLALETTDGDVLTIRGKLKVHESPLGTEYQYVGGTGAWTIARAGDVDLTDRAEDDVLAWDATAQKYVHRPRGAGGGGSFDGDHNDLDGREANDAHPQSAITGLTSALSGKAATSHTHSLSDITNAGGAAALNVGTTAGTVAAGDHGHAQLHDAATVSGNGISLSGQQISLSIGTGATQVAAGDDSRFTDERVPTAAGLTTKFGTNKATLVDGDKVAILDSEASDAPKHGLWSLVKSTLKTYFDTLYAIKGAITTSGLTIGTGKLAGRTTASTGALEEIGVTEGLKLASTTLSAAGTTQTLTDQATIVWDLTAGSIAKTQALTANRALDLNSTTPIVPGKLYLITFLQDGTGGRTIALNASHFELGGASLVLSASANAEDTVAFVGNHAGSKLRLAGAGFGF
jgi:hypothetical protein